MGTGARKEFCYDDAFNGYPCSCAYERNQLELREYIRKSIKNSFRKGAFVYDSY
jgi:hypothetical protein